uniref:Uncharacterized protein n=1 Tax=viral metagenome TaxID=1070528 RepID=A0A6H2A408_9ZZZZ
MKRVEVEFLDSNFQHGWDDCESIDLLARTTGIGYLKTDNEEQITLVMANSEFGNVFGKFTIPRVAVVSIKELRIK